VQLTFMQKLERHR